MNRINVEISFSFGTSPLSFSRVWGLGGRLFETRGKLNFLLTSHLLALLKIIQRNYFFFFFFFSFLSFPRGKRRGRGEEKEKKIP